MTSFEMRSVGNQLSNQLWLRRVLKQQKPAKCGHLCGVDETRTRGLLRDRQAL